MPLPTFDELHRKADAAQSPTPVAIAGGADPTVLAAYRHAADRGWAAPVLIGPEAETRELASRQGTSLHGLTLLDADGPDIARAAVALAREGQAAIVAKGRVATPDLMRAVLDPEHGLRTGRVIAQHVLMELPRDDRRLLLADTGITIRPTLDQKAQLVEAIVALARALGESAPKVALMAATEKTTESMPETLDAVELTRRNQAGAFPSASVQGPLSFDLAYAADAGDRKHIEGEVVGAADALVFPDLLSANLTVKAIMYTADCRFGGVLRGTTAPVAFMSRADSAATRLNSLALALAILRSERP